MMLIDAVFAFIGTDCAAHLAEEIPNPSRNVPRAIMWPILLGFCIAWPFAVACVASITDLEKVLGGQTGFPLLTIYYQATGSKAGATVLLTMFIICFFGCLTACITTCCRTLWAVSRDDALPYSKYWMKVSPTFQMPLNATCLSGVVMSVSTTSLRALCQCLITSAIRPNLPRISQCLLVNDQRLHHLLPDLSGDPTGYRALAWTGESTSTALFCHSRTMGQGC